MRKITSLLMLFCAFVGTAWAQLVETSTEASPKYYAIASYNRGGVLTNTGVGNDLTHVDLSDAGYWYFEKANEDGGVYIVSKLKDGENKVYVGSDRKASTTQSVWYIIENGVNKEGVAISAHPTINGNCIDANNHNTGVGTWAPNTSDWQGTTWVIYSPEDFEDAIYNPNSLTFRSRSDRKLNSISLVSSMESATVTLNHDYTGYGFIYHNNTATTIKAVAGEELTASVATTANWMNTYAYIDADGTPGFSASIDADGHTPAGDLVSYSFYSGDEADDTSGKNSEGTELTTAARNTKVLPTFNAPTTPGTYRMRIKLDWNSIDPNGGNTNFMGNGGSFVDVMLEVIDPHATCDVVYNFVYGGETKYTQTSAGQVGEEYPAITIANQFVYGVTAVKPEGVIEAGDVVEGKVTKTIELTDNLPFVAATDYASIQNWYYLKFHATLKNYLYYDSDLTYIDASKTAVDAGNKDAYTWAFIGNPFDGFKVVNKLAGADMILSSAAEPTTDKEYPVMTATSAISGNTYWDLSASTYGTNGFFMAYDGTNKRLNKQDNKLCYWLDGADAGSTFMVEERDLTGRAELQALVEQVKAVQGNYVAGTTVGYLTQASIDAVASAVTGAEEALAGTITAEISAQHQVAINNAIAALETVQPEEGKYYTIQNAYSNIYAGVGNGGGMVSAGEINLGQVFQFVAAGEGKFYLYNVERGSYLSSAPAHGYGQVAASAFETANAKAVTIANFGKENRVSIIPQGGTHIHHDAGQGTIVGWTGDAESRSAWYITELNDVTSVSHSVNISDAEWASLVLGCDATIPAGVKAYAVSTIGTESATLTEITDAIPAGEAVLLNGAAGTYNFAVAESAAAVAGNKLEGTVFNTNIAKAAWILGLNEGVAGLYTVTLDQEEGTAFTNNAFKAYLPKTSTEGALRLEIGTTGIENAIVGENGNAAIFDLSGRRVSKMQKGIYIVNGKKVYVK